MIWIKLLSTAQGRDINLPESVSHRSVEGTTLILIPGQSQEVTDEEWEHIKTAHPDLLSGIQVLNEGHPSNTPTVADSSDVRPSEPGPLPTTEQPTAVPVGGPPRRDE